MTAVESNLSIGQVAERTGLSVHALRFYEREGILANPVGRDSAGRRVYGEDDVDWLTVCTVLRAAGMPMPEIRRYTELVRQGEGNVSERLALLRTQQQRVTEQMDQLTKCLDLVAYKIGVYEDILADDDADD
ncbi:MAG TPA: MerR family transcriptional regulator [Pseudonocardiaceae bacterium]|nr:MerR family transcriptional regulator [Pseudonocardiaceae bacterium]